MRPLKEQKNKNIDCVNMALDSFAFASLACCLLFNNLSNDLWKNVATLGFELF